MAVFIALVLGSPLLTLLSLWPKDNMMITLFFPYLLDRRILALI